MPPSSSPAVSRDWSDLGDGPAGLIADRVLAFDVADYARFRAVCSSWRRCSADPRAHGSLDRRFHPRRWTMLREKLAAPDRRRFLNTSTGECVQVDIPEIRDYELLGLTPEGLLVLVHKPPLTTVRLLNPLTRHLTELPPLTTLLPYEDPHWLLDRGADSDEFRALGSGIASDDSTVVLCLERLSILGVAKPGDDHWRVLDYIDFFNSKDSALMFAGRFYRVHDIHGVMVLETSPLRLEVAAGLNMPRGSVGSVQLVNNFGELMMVHRSERLCFSENKAGWRYDVYRVDLDTGTLLPVESLGGNAVFMGMRCSLSVSPHAFPPGSISADTIYLSFDVSERWQHKVAAYHLRDGSVERATRYWRGLVPCPHTLVDCLSLSNCVRKYSILLDD